VKEQIDSLTLHGCVNDVLFINGRDGGKIEYVKSILRIRKVFLSKKYDVVHCHHSLSALCYILSGLSNKIKPVVSYQNAPEFENGRHIYAFIKKHSSAIILKNNSPEVDGTFIYHQPNGVNLSHFRPIDRQQSIDHLGLDASKRYILFVSSNYLRKQKRFDVFRSVVEALKTKYGHRDLEILSLINTKRDLVPYYFNAASLHLLTSDFEGSPNSVKEAMACETPVVSTSVGNVTELLKGVIGSYVSESNEVDVLAEYSNRVLKQEFGLNSRDKLIEYKMDADSVSNNIINIYKKLVP
jgi:glycosyltransferase involved in cell wall biosynthesis